MKDCKDLVENINNINVSKWLLFVPCPYRLKDAKWWVNDCKKKAKEKNSYELVVELRSEKRIIGGISLRKIDKFQGKASVGYWTGEKYWRQGYGSEALDAILKFAFNKLKLRRIGAGVIAGNPSSGKMLEKFGFKKEGLKRKACRSKANKEIYDEYTYGLLKEEWKKIK